MTNVTKEAWTEDIRKITKDVWKCVDFQHTFSIISLFRVLPADLTASYRELHVYSTLNQWAYFIYARSHSPIMLKDDRSFDMVFPESVQELGAWFRAAEHYITLLNESRDHFRRIRDRCEAEWERLRSTYNRAAEAYESLTERASRSGRDSLQGIVPLTMKSLFAL